MEGIVVGGNIRCLLKLAGTPYWPDMREKLLLLESFGGKLPQMVTYLSQLNQMGVFKKVNGILLGTFTKMEEDNCQPDMAQLVLEFAEKKTPVAKSPLIGHGTDSKAIRIGHRLKLILRRRKQTDYIKNLDPSHSALNGSFSSSFATASFTLESNAAGRI